MKAPERNGQDNRRVEQTVSQPSKRASPKEIERSKSLLEFLRDQNDAARPLNHRIADYLLTKGLTRRHAQRIKDCSAPIEHRILPNGIYEITNLRRCRLWDICPLCATMRARQRIKRWSDDIVSIVRILPSTLVWEVLVNPKPGQDLYERSHVLSLGMSRLSAHGADVRRRERKGINTSSPLADLIACFALAEVERVPEGGKKHAARMRALGKFVRMAWFVHAHGLILSREGFDPRAFLSEAKRVLGPGFEIKMYQLPRDAQFLRKPGLERTPSGLSNKQQGERLQQLGESVRDRFCYMTKSRIADMARKSRSIEELEEGAIPLDLGTISQAYRVYEGKRPLKRDLSGKRAVAARGSFGFGAAHNTNKFIDTVSKQNARRTWEMAALMRRVRQRREALRGPQKVVPRRRLPSTREQNASGKSGTGRAVESR